MKLWILKARVDRDNPVDPWVTPYDTIDSQIVRADSRAAARKLADTRGGDENRVCDASGEPVRPWLKPAYTTCRELPADGPATVILTSGQSG